jgi:hypothetical protein
MPMMKTVIRSSLKDVDDMPGMYFKNLDNDKQAEVLKNEYWNETAKYNKFEIQDIVDKKQNMITGRSFDHWQVVDGMIAMSIESVFDIVLSRYTKPWDIHTSRFLIHEHIFRPLRELINNDEFNQEAVMKLVEFYSTTEGQIKASDNFQSLVDKNEKLKALGIEDVDDPILGETYVELNNHFRFYAESDSDEEEIWLFVTCDDLEILSKKKLEEIIGTTSDNYWKTHYPYNSWADDVELDDFWSDGLGDIVRQPNIVLNTWYSQMIETRTLRGLGMHYYNSNIDGFTPQTNEPRAFGWYGIPVPTGGTIDDVIKKVDIPDLSDSRDEIEFMIGMIEKATGATSTQQGVESKRDVTLGEIKLALGEAKERVQGMSKMYTQVWKERALMFTKMIEAAHDQLKPIQVNKKGRNSDNMYTREISPSDWMTSAGYMCEVWSVADKKEKDTEQLEIQAAIKQNMPDNPVVDSAYKRKLLEFGEYKPEEVEAAMKYEQEKAMMMAQMPMQIDPATGQPMQQQPMALPAGQPTA